MADARRLVDKLWSYCNVLRDDDVGTVLAEQHDELAERRRHRRRPVRGLARRSAP